MAQAERRVLAGAVWGFEVWICFALAEYVFATLVPLLSRPHAILAPEQWCGLAVLFGCYAAIGLLIGAAAGIVIRGPDPEARLLRKLVLLSTILAPNLAGYAPWPARCAVAAAAAVTGLAIWRNQPLGALGFSGRAVLSGMLLNFAGYFAEVVGGSFPGWWLAVALPGAIIVLLGLTALLAAALASGLRSIARPPVVIPLVRAAIVLALIAGAAIVSSQAEGSPPAPRRSPVSDRPNVLLIVLDTVAADHMGIYGYARNNTPHLGEFADHATLYTNMVAAAPWTLPSHASIFSGLYPQSHGAFASLPDYPQGRPLPDTIPTLASSLTSAGYRTLAASANYHCLRPDFGVTRGFQFFDWQKPVELVDSRSLFLRRRISYWPSPGMTARSVDMQTITAEEINRRAFRLLAGAAAGPPFFLFLNYMDAHEPILPPPPYDRKYPGSGLRYGWSLDFWVDFTTVNEHSRPLDQQRRDYLVSQYDGAIGYLDEQLGKLLAFLKTEGLYDRMLIVITSDHGEAFGEHNILGHRAGLYQDEIHVPLIVKYPGQQRPRRVDMPASHVDLMPTVLETAGVAVPPGLQGISLLHLAGAEGRPVVAQFDGTTAAGRFACCQFALFSGSHKLIYSTTGAAELYDLTADPGETHDLSRPDAGLTASLRDKLLDWSRRTSPRNLSTQPADRRTIERLKSLGYAR